MALQLHPCRQYRCCPQAPTSHHRTATTWAAGGAGGGTRCSLLHSFPSPVAVGAATTGAMRGRTGVTRCRLLHGFPGLLQLAQPHKTAFASSWESSSCTDESGGGCLCDDAACSAATAAAAAAAGCTPLAMFASRPSTTRFASSWYSCTISRGRLVALPSTRCPRPPPSCAPGLASRCMNWRLNCSSADGCTNDDDRLPAQ
mmetsp:Transcript_27190/g.80661  ORF Transcript_27190/g.80661 Transcript_27190/m.80661 type:complete len:201 (-) Transcript_27190:1359-1961(-)